MTQPLAYSIEGAAEAVGLSIGTVRTAIREGRLKAKRTSSRIESGERIGSGYTVVTVGALQNWLDGLVDA